MPPAEALPPPPAWLGLVEAGLIVFLAAFLLIVLKVVLTRRGRYEDAARIPLDDDRSPP
jgi:hypothetical protein